MNKKQLAEWFHDKLLVDYYKWRSTLPRGDWRGVRYKSLLTRFGGVGTMKQLLNSPNNKKINALEFGAEEIVVAKRFRPLFTASEIKEARRRLKSK